ncbi:MAG TPA: hypothetical protein DD435_00530 [Cyanobacteria bacterium UBA8530]|nr:hypothetical protein [Cyanobacteria bacterium UBA8530]
MLSSLSSKHFSSSFSLDTASPLLIQSENHPRVRQGPELSFAQAPLPILGPVPSLPGMTTSFNRCK